MLGLAVTTEGFCHLQLGLIPTSILHLLRGGIYLKLTKSGLTSAATAIRDQNVLDQYNEVANEIENLRNIISTVTEDLSN